MTQIEGKQYLDPKVLQKIKHLDVIARSVVEGFITGLHESPFHGFAVEFATHREYTPGDEIKHIDWKVWSKTDRFYIKEYEEETNLKCNIILDASKSMRYGEDVKGVVSKFDYGSTLAACLAFLMQKQQDAVGLMTFDTEVRMNMSAQTSHNHLRQMISNLQQTEPDNQTDVGDVFPKLAESIKGRGLVVLISDLFVDTDILKSALQRFRHKKHDMVVFHLLHEHELDFPFQENTRFVGLEVDARVQTDPRALKKSYLKVLDEYLQQVRRCCSAAGIDYVQMNTHDPLDVGLHEYLAFRQQSVRANTRRR